MSEEELPAPEKPVTLNYWPLDRDFDDEPEVSTVTSFHFDGAQGWLSMVFENGMRQITKIQRLLIQSPEL